MENINEVKNIFVEKFHSLSKERQEKILEYYSIGGVNSLLAKARREARAVIDFADRKGYGYGEVDYYIKEDIKDFSDEVPELEKEYKNLVYSYFEILTETLEA